MVSALISFIHLMALYPEVQRKAQREVDMLSGRDQLPRASHIVDYQYMRAVLKEVLRYAPVANLGEEIC